MLRAEVVIQWNPIQIHRKTNNKYLKRYSPNISNYFHQISQTIFTKYLKLFSLNILHQFSFHTVSLFSLKFCYTVFLLLTYSVIKRKRFNTTMPFDKKVFMIQIFTIQTIKELIIFCHAFVFSISINFLPFLENEII